MGLPTVTIVFLVYNRREELRRSLHEMLERSDYPQELVDVIVVDNASEDGSSEMVREEFPAVRLIRRDVNVGVSGWNDGFAVAEGEWILALDDDCYLPGDRLRRAMESALAREADLVSFGVVSSEDARHRFDHRYRTGLLSFWGCAWLAHRRVIERLRGFDPEIFVWANELEFMMRFFDAGFRHLHEPDIHAVHMKPPPKGHWSEYHADRAYFINQRHFAYIAAKLMRPRDAIEALVALAASSVRSGIVIRPEAARALTGIVKGFLHGLRHRAPVASPRVSRTYRHSFESYASPWWMSRPLHQMPVAWAAALLRRVTRRPPAPKHPGRHEDYLRERAAYYPETAATLQL